MVTVRSTSNPWYCLKYHAISLNCTQSRIVFKFKNLSKQENNTIEFISWLVYILIYLVLLRNDIRFLSVLTNEITTKGTGKNNFI